MSKLLFALIAAVFATASMVAIADDVSKTEMKKDTKAEVSQEAVKGDTEKMKADTEKTDATKANAEKAEIKK